MDGTNKLLWVGTNKIFFAPLGHTTWRCPLPDTILSITNLLVWLLIVWGRGRKSSPYMELGRTLGAAVHWVRVSGNSSVSAAAAKEEEKENGWVVALSYVFIDFLPPPSCPLPPSFSFSPAAFSSCSFPNLTCTQYSRKCLSYIHRFACVHTIPVLVFFFLLLSLFLVLLPPAGSFVSTYLLGLLLTIIATPLGLFMNF